MCCSCGDLCTDSLGTLFAYQRRILNGATFRTRAEPLQLRSSSGCKRCILNASFMLHTSGCRRYTLKVACRLNVRAVSSQSRPRCMVDQPTCEAVKVPILSVLLAFTDHSTPKTQGYTLRSHGCLHSSLPLLSAAYASASTRSLCAPQRAHNAVSFCQCALPCDRLAGRFGGRALPPQLQRVLALSPASVGRLPSALLRTTFALSARNRFSRSFPPSSPLGEPGEESMRPTLLPADSCRTAGIEEMGLHRSRQSVVACNRRPRVETAASLTTRSTQRDKRLSRACGRQVISADDRLGSV